MTSNSRFSTTNMYSEQPPARINLLKVLLYIALALISGVVWIHSLFVPSLTKNWPWICSLFILGLIIGSGGLAFSNLKKRRLSTQNVEQQETASISEDSKQAYTLLMWLYAITMLALIAILFLIVPTLSLNWQWICGLVMIGSCGLILWDFNKRRLAAKGARVSQGTSSSPTTSQPGFSLLIWLCSILEVALFATLIVMQFNGDANAKELSQISISGFSVSLFLWLAYRAYRYIDR